MGKWSDRQSAKDVILTRYIDRRRFFWKLDVWCTQSCMGSARTCMRASINQAYEPMPVPVIWKPLLIESVVCSQTNAFQSLTVEQYHSCIVSVCFYFVSRTFSPFLHCHLVTFLPRVAMQARVIAIATCLSVCLFVRPSVTRRYCVKTKKASGIISSPSGSPKTLVFRRQTSSPNSKGFPPNGGFKEGSVEEFSDFFSFKRQYLENGSRYGQSYYQ